MRNHSAVLSKCDIHQRIQQHNRMSTVTYLHIKTLSLGSGMARQKSVEQFLQLTIGVSLITF